MKNTSFLYKFIIKKNFYKVDKNNFINFNTKNNLYFSNYLKKNLLKDNLQLKFKYYILKSYGKWINSINDTYLIFQTKNFFFLRLITITKLLINLLNPLKKSLKSNLVIEKNKLFDKKVFICFEFPSHAFNKSQFENSSFYNSINSSYNNFKILSINSYSKNKTNKIIENEDIIFTSTKISIKNFFFIILRSLKKLSIFFFTKNIPIEIKLITLGNIIETEYVKTICNIVKKKIKTLDKIFFLSFNNPFHFNETIKDIKIGEFFYSDNVITPPILYIYLTDQIQNNFKKIIGPNLLSMSNHQCGLTDNLNLIENYKTKFLKIPKNPNNKINIKKSMLGFRNKNIKFHRGKYSLIFDIPPYVKKHEKYVSRVSFDIMKSRDFCINFLNDFYDIQQKLNCKILLKPKYFAPDNSYPDYYKNLLAKFESLDLLIDPYSELNDLLNNASHIFAAPYTSMGRIYNTNKIHYYLPSSYKSLSYFDKNLIVGKKELESFFK
jgi:hypothetical protein